METYYHVTRKDYLPSILANGIDPDRRLGRIRGTWYVTSRRIWWGIRHVAKRHRIGVEYLAIVQVNPRGLALINTPHKGVYRCVERLDETRILQVYHLECRLMQPSRQPSRDQQAPR